MSVANGNPLTNDLKSGHMVGCRLVILLLQLVQRMVVWLVVELGGCVLVANCIGCVLVEYYEWW